MWNVYTDGACRGNPGPGGGGFSVEKEGKEILLEECGGDGFTTNNRMELQAVIHALESIGSFSLLPDVVVVHTDSTYVFQGITQWIHGWKRNGWKTSKKQPVLNEDLWRTLDALVTSFCPTLQWKWVKAHCGHPGNERADALANQGVDFYRNVEPPPSSS
jgi:ribonuclease HI